MMNENEKVLYKIDNTPRLLKAEEIECRVGTIKGNGLTLLLYKDARVDMRILDETYGVGNWQRTHEVINGNLFCNIEIWNDRINKWIKKQDVGTESYNEKEKGEASDSFKRAGFNVGIGRELYTSPFIWIQPRQDMKPYNVKDSKGNEANEFYLQTNPKTGKDAFVTKTVFKVKEIGYNENREINKLIIIDNKNNVRFNLIPEEEQKEWTELYTKMLNIVEKRNIDREYITKHYKIDNTNELTIEQLKECIIILNKSKGE